MKKRTLIVMMALLTAWVGCRADEGMWIPMLLKKYNIEDMQRQGFRLTAEDIYAINQASLKDAVIGLGREGRPFSHFCTGELISDEGLMVTNHHCAFGMIQAHSSLEHNYLRDGFWAASRQEELANPGITASILVRMEDVTDQINARLTSDMTDEQREAKVVEVCKELEKNAVEGTNLHANIKPYFNGNQYFMSVFKIYKDVRLVGAPPSAIGKFGGDTDNWMWPRHTGDFSVLRIYAGEDNEPADYSPDNRPFRPATFFKVSAKGLHEGDFTMVFGYPGTTQEYLTSYAVEQIQEVENPNKVAIRTSKLNVINAAMNSDELLRIKYASKAASVANAWKKWQGEIKGLKRFNTVGTKRQEEDRFRQWAQGNPAYRDLLDTYRKLYDERRPLALAAAYLNEAGRSGAEIVGWAGTVYNAMSGKSFAEDPAQAKSKLKARAEEYFKDYDAATDQKVLVEMLILYNRGLSAEWIPAEVQAAAKKGIEAYVANLFRKSVFASRATLDAFIDKADTDSYRKLEKDPAYRLYASITAFNRDRIQPGLSRIEQQVKRLNKTWLKAQMEMQPDKRFYADANSTLRISYGKVQGYAPNDAVYYKHFTTLRGIMEKDNPDIYDYDVPERLREIYRLRDFGPYTQDGEVPVCFVATNHTTGGNSGSPVLNADGHLIGLNFDRAWDGVMSDLQYHPEICRNISVDIRYVLFIIDKLAGARHLLDEMEIVTE